MTIGNPTLRNPGPLPRGVYVPSYLVSPMWVLQPDQVKPVLRVRWLLGLHNQSDIGSDAWCANVLIRT